MPNAQCRRCCNGDETDKHLLFDCIYAQQIWRASGISNTILTDPHATLEEKIEVCLQCCTSTRLRHLTNLPFWLLWRIWKSRNLLIFQNKQIDGRQVLQQARRDAQEWSTHSTTNASLGRSNISGQQILMRNQRWKRPPVGWLECNVDASFVNAETPSKAEWIIRDEHGTYKGAGQGIGVCVRSPMEGEIQGIIMAMQQCWARGYTRVIFETDCKQATDLLNGYRDSIL